MIPLALLLVSAPPDVRVDFETAGARLEALLPRLGERAGVRLEATPSVRGEVLALRLRQMPLTEAMRRIAEVADAEWQAHGTGFRLIRPAATARRLEGRSLARRAERIASVQATAREDARPFDPTGFARRLRQAVERFEPNAPDPAVRALDRERMAVIAARDLLLRLPPEELATLAEGEHRVYAAEPTTVQSPFPPAGAAVVREFLAGREAFAREARRLGLAPPVRGRSTHLFNQAIAEVSRADEAPVRALAVVSRVQDHLRAEFQVFDKDGVSLSRGDFFLGMVSLSPGQVQALSATGGDRVPLHPLWVEMQRLREAPGTAPSEELRQRILDPLAHEPLEVLAGWTLLEWARKRDRDLVAFLPEQALAWTAPDHTDVREEALPILLDVLDMARKEEGRVWTLRSRDAHAARSQRFDRIALREVVTEARRTGRVGLGTRVLIARASRGPSSPTLPFLLLQGLGLNLLEFGGGAADADLLRLYGGLSPNQTMVAERAGLPLRALTPEQRGLLARLVYERGRGLEVSPNANTPPAAVGAQWNLSVWREPTQALPDGLPMEARLRIEREEMYGVLSPVRRVEGETVDAGRPMPAALLGEWLARKARPDLFPNADIDATNLNLARLRPVVESRIVFSVAFGEGVRWSRTLSDFSLAQRPVAFQDLPESFRREAERHRDAFLKSHERG